MSGALENKPLVSICCITYNHENYIRQALDSFLMQKTEFPVEIIIHDDASTDNTAAIIKEYEKSHPSIIHAICQTENQKSKYGGGMNPRFNYPRAKGKYIALCDGDDYWIEDTKLQKQFEFMEQNPNCSFCFHNTKLYFEDTDSWNEQVLPTSAYENNFVKNSVIFRRLGGAYPTASAFFKKEIVKKIPDYFYDFKVGDSPLILSAIENGKVGFMNVSWSVYRINKGNWTNSQKSLPKKLKHYETSRNGLESFNVATKGKFSKEVSITKEHSTYQLVYFYLTLGESFGNKLKFIKKYSKRLSFKNLLKSFYWLIRYQFV